MVSSLNDHRATPDCAYYAAVAKARGWWLIPILLKQKAPYTRGWEWLRIAPEKFKCYFQTPCNAGVLLGVQDTDGRYLIDVDLDSPEAVQLADEYLPPTDCVFGRQGKPASHRFYYVHHRIPTKRCKDANGKMIVELRGTGCQTVIPGSVHPSGEPIEWVKDGEPAEIDPADLQAAVERLAEACGARPRADVVPMPAPQPTVNGKLADTPVVADPADADWYARCQKYLEKAPDSISGQGGHDAMLRACCEAYRFGLDDSAASQLAVWYNANKCSPRWSERELQHKLADAKKLVDAAGEFGIRRKPGTHTTPLADAAPQAAAAEPAPDWEPMPLDCLPDAVREYVWATAAALGCPPEYVVMPLLAVLASAIGNSRRIALKKTWSEPAVVWACVIAKSGTLKSPAHDKVVELLLHRQDELLAEYSCEKQRYDEDMQAYEDERRSRNKPPAGERMPKPMAPIRKRLYTSDTTVEALCAVLAENPRGVLLERDELAAWLESFDRYAARSGADQPAWLSIHRASRVTIDRKTGARFINVPRAAVSICGTIQPGTLIRCLTPESFEAGLAARLLFVQPPSLKKVWTDAEVPEDVKKAMQVLVERLLDLRMIDKVDDKGNPSLEPMIVPMDADARAQFIEFYNSHAEEQRGLGDDRQCAAWSKLEAYSARFALIFALCENPDATAVDALSMHNAIRLTRWLCSETRRVYAMFGGKPDEGVADAAILPWLADRGGAATLSELRNFKRCYRRPGAAEEAVERLIAAGHVRWDIPDSGPSGGRPASRFRIAKA